MAIDWDKKSADTEASAQLCLKMMSCVALALA
jgi:hypothetical protein